MKKPVMFNDKAVTIRRIATYIVGLFVMAMGIAFAVNSDFGVSPVTTVPYVVARLMDQSIGVGTIVAFIIFMLIELCIYRRHFKVTYILQFPAAIMFGYFTDFTKFLITPLGIPDFWPMQLVYVFIGIVLVALGLRAYLTADIMSIPSDAVPVAMAWATKKPLHVMKRIFDCCCVAVSLALSLIFFQDWQGLWIGTILAALGVGTVLKFWTILILKPLETFLYGKEQDGKEQDAKEQDTPAAVSSAEAKDISA